MDRLYALFGVAVIVALAAGAFAFYAPAPQPIDEGPSEVVIGDGDNSSDAPTNNTTSISPVTPITNDSVANEAATPLPNSTNSTG